MDNEDMPGCYTGDNPWGTLRDDPTPEPSAPAEPSKGDCAPRYPWHPTESELDPASTHIEQIAERLASGLAIGHDNNYRIDIYELLIEFAKEVQRASIEPEGF